ncbi:MAG: hypothetical protein M1831_001301 [Alyxoria varia]|nr:MAG: hypothetical protein M1831_001301 [Alyxoria varia]
MPTHTKSAEFMLDLVNEDFGSDSRLHAVEAPHPANKESDESNGVYQSNEPTTTRTKRIQEAWAQSAFAKDLAQELQSTASSANPNNTNRETDATTTDSSARSIIITTRKPRTNPLLPPYPPPPLLPTIPP